MTQSLWHRYAWVAYGAVFLGMLGHASTEFVSVLTGVAGAELSVWRFSLGSLGLIIISVVMNSPVHLFEPLRHDAVPLVVMSIVGVGIGYLVFHIAIDYASIAQVATTVTTMPIFVGLLNQWRNGVRIDGPKWLTGIAAILGVALLVTDGALEQLRGDAQSLIGIGGALLCAIFVGAYTLFARPYIVKYGALRITTLTLSMASISLWLMVGFVFGTFVDFTTVFDRAPGELTALLTLAFFNTTITQFFWLGGLAAVPDITRGSYIFFLKPVIAAWLAVWIIGQPVSAMAWLAIFIICGSVAIEALWPRKTA